MKKSKNISQGKNIPQYSFATSNPCPNICPSVKRGTVCIFLCSNSVNSLRDMT